VWLAGNKNATLTVYLSRAGFTVLNGQTVLHAHECEGALENAQALQKWLRESNLRANIRVFLSASLCRPFLASVPGGLSPQESERAWAAAATQRTGVSADSSIWRDTPASGEKQIAAAVESALLAQLLHIAKSGIRGMRISAVRPAWAEWLRISLAQDARASSVVLHEADSVTVLAGQDGTFDVAATVLTTHDAITTRAAVDRLLLIAGSSDKPPCQARLQLRHVQKPMANASGLAHLLEAIE
jgi:hypothetical protein